MFRAFILLSSFCITLPAIVHAQPQPRVLEAAERESWHHQSSGLSIPPELLGLTRTNISDYSDDQRNIMAGFGNQQGTEILSLYIFKPAISSTSIWHDRAQTSIKYIYFQSQENMPHISKSVPVPTTPEIQALLAIYQFPSGQPRRTTGLATVEVNGWITKVRYTSSTLTIEAMEKQILHMLADFARPDGKGSTAPATFIEPCATAMKWAKAKSSPVVGGDVIADAFSVKIGDFLGAETAHAPSDENFCRAELHPSNSIYRLNEAADSYILAHGDAGQFIAVSRLQDSDRPLYRASYSHYSDTYILPRFQSLPTPQQVTQLVNDNKFLARVDPAGHITLFTANIKK